MEDQKAENLLNLALSVPEEMRERTEELNVGFNRKERTWEIIVKYHGDLGSALNAKFPDASGTYLFNDFAILRVPERDVPGVIALPEIEYAEKPKRLFFASNMARAASCLEPGEGGLLFSSGADRDRWAYGKRCPGGGDRLGNRHLS